MDRLSDFCRQIGCGARLLLDDGLYNPEIHRERIETVVAVQCDGCRARQYEQYLKAGDGGEPMRL